MTNYVWVTTQKEMIHKYDNAPDEVHYLRNEHRHLFKFKIWLEVFHNDRDVEFIMLKHFIDDSLNYINKILGINKSCEMISDYLYGVLKDKYQGRKIKISVSEDGESGSEKEYWLEVK